MWKDNIQIQIKTWKGQWLITLPVYNVVAIIAYFALFGISRKSPS